MAKAFPRFLYVKREALDDGEFFVADEDSEALCEKGEIITIAKYELVESDRYKLVKQRT